MKLTQLFFDFKSVLRRETAGGGPAAAAAVPAESAPGATARDLTEVNADAAEACPFPTAERHAGGGALQPGEAEPAAPFPRQAGEVGSPGKAAAEDTVLMAQCREWLKALGLDGAAKLVRVMWNPRLRSTAGYARYPAWSIELNPRLKDFDGQVERTLKHELAHLVAYHRAGRRRIEPHGAEWQRACVDLGIPDESARHQLPLPRSEVRRNFTYACPACSVVVRRVRKFRRFSACSACCNRHNGGRYDARFRFILIEPQPGR